MNKRRIHFTLNYISNFKPKINFNKIILNTLFSQTTDNYKIVCRNIFLFFLFLKFCTQKKFLFKIKLFIKPEYFNTATMLRAPYRYKLGRYQYTINRFFFSCKFELDLAAELEATNKVVVCKLIRLCNKLCKNFESNMCSIHSVYVKFYINFLNFFKINWV